MKGSGRAQQNHRAIYGSCGWSSERPALSAEGDRHHKESQGGGAHTLAFTAVTDRGDFQTLLHSDTQSYRADEVNMEMDEDGTMSEWEAVLELDEALAGWLMQGPARGEWGWEWGWAASNLQDPEWDDEDIPAVS